MNKSECFLQEFNRTQDFKETCVRYNITPELVHKLVLRDVNFCQQLFLIYFEIFQGNVHYACKEVGVSRSYIMSIAKKYQVFAERIWELTESFIDLAESTLFKLGVYGGQLGTGDEKALKTYLEAKAKNRGYGIKEIINREIYPGIPEHKEENKRIDFQEKIKKWPTEDIENSLKLLKRLLI